MLNKLLVKYRRTTIFLAHILFIIGAYVFAFYIRFDFTLPVRCVQIILKTVPFLILIKAVIFYWCGLYSGIWRYVSMHDMWQILKANVISTVIFILFVIFSRGLIGYPRSVFILDWVLCVGFITGARYLTRVFREGLQPVRHVRSTRALIVGAGEAGILFLRELQRSVDFHIVGFIDDDQTKINSRIYGVKVLGKTDDIKEIAKKYNIEEIIIAIPSASGKTMRDIISKCEETKTRIKTVPEIRKILTGEIAIKQIRDVRPEDLLTRETVKINTEDVSSLIEEKRVLVTGAAGTIGSELCRQIAGFHPEKLILYDHNENDIYFLELELKEKYAYLKFETLIGDIKDIGLLKYAFSRYKPQVVFHSAAHKHVPLMEENPVAAVKNNIIGTRNFMYAAEHYGVESFVMISTDKAVNPTSVMGTSKRIAEMMIQAKAKTARTKFMAVRFGNVIGSSGSAVPIFKQQI